MLNMNCRGCRQRFLPLPDLSSKIDGDSVRRVIVPSYCILIGYRSGTYTVCHFDGSTRPISERVYPGCKVSWDNPPLVMWYNWIIKRDLPVFNLKFGWDSITWHQKAGRSHAHHLLALPPSLDLSFAGSVCPVVGTRVRFCGVFFTSRKRRAISCELPAFCCHVIEPHSNFSLQVSPL